LPARQEASLEVVVVELQPTRPIAERIALKGVTVDVTSEIVLTVDATGQQLTVEQYFDFARQRILERIPSREELRRVWLDPSDRASLIEELENGGVHTELIAELKELADADGFDVLANLAFGDPLVSRAERVTGFLNHGSDWLGEFDEAQQALILEILDAYRVGGVESFGREVLQLERFRKYGGGLQAVRAFGGTAGFDGVVSALKEGIYSIEEAA
jgi:type I restriction enzyme R subunit